MSRNSSRTHLDKQCQECGCVCDGCDNSIHLHQEIESLKERLKEREQQILTMESQILVHANQYPNGEMQAMKDNLYNWQDKYERLLENYRKLQKINQGLEDKLLRLADRFENERVVLNKNVSDLKTKLDDAEQTIQRQDKENKTFKNDFDLLIQIIQNNSQSTIITMDSLDENLQKRIRQQLDEKQRLREDNNNKEPIRVPIPTFPPTAVLYSLHESSSKKVENNNQPESPIRTTLSPALMSQLYRTTNNSNNICRNCNDKLSKEFGSGSRSNSDRDSNRDQDGWTNRKTMII